MSDIKHLRPRVWFVDQVDTEIDGAFDAVVTKERQNKTDVKVHDSAYVELLERIVERQSEALEFYANRENWMRSYITNGEDIAASKWADKLKVQDCAMLNCGGGRARLAQTSVQQMCEEFKG